MDEELRAELLARCEEDQRVRQAAGERRLGLGPFADYQARMGRRG